jgi:hypothetical protein
MTQERGSQMAYVNPNFGSKKALKDALKTGELGSIEVFQPGLGVIPANGTVCLEGPHYPQAHTWYATGIMKDGKLVKVS